MDGNFKAKHLHPVNPSNEVSLMDSCGFMVGDAVYKQHLAVAQDTIQRLECNNHCAVNQANASCHWLEATGIGGCACAQHGCFVPHAMVDFQKGERQMNMDYALCEALKMNTKGIHCVLTFYNVNCQYHKCLKDCIAKSPILEVPKELDIIPGIGLWHVHGHQDSCYIRYASNFIKGATWINGKIMEMLWALLNIILLAAHGMGTPHCKECLDYQMNDCNFMKMIRMSKSLCKTFDRALRGVADSKLAFEKLHDSTDPMKVHEWEAKERLAHQWCHNDPTAMDIYEVQLQKVLMKKQHNYWWNKGNAQGLSTNEARVAFLGDDEYHGMEIDLIMLDENSDAAMEDPSKFFQPEKAIIPLPSNLGERTCTAIGVNDLLKQELTLWEGQANDALHNIKYIWQTKVVSIQASIYLKYCKQLSHLGADHALLQQYQTLAKEHLKRHDVIGADLANMAVYWVHWLQAKALKDRWLEEILLVWYKMDWMCDFFLYKAQE
ncbi:hypothetical protein BDR06DRAFT_1029808 [Suillus hirtellus]|nr:hypothetical protein BDR06DRAFT_1029808 [Suillus hirtellus]